MLLVSLQYIYIFLAVNYSLIPIGYSII